MLIEYITTPFDFVSDLYTLSYLANLTSELF